MILVERSNGSLLSLQDAVVRLEINSESGRKGGSLYVEATVAGRNM